MTQSREWTSAVSGAIERRRALLGGQETEACRVLHGSADGVPGVFVDRFGPGATLIRHLGAAAAEDTHAATLAGIVLEGLRPFGVRAVYDKPFVRDRSSGERLHVLTNPTPIAGTPLPECVMVREHGRVFEIRFFDGFSVGLFLDQRANRSFLSGSAGGQRVLNLFAYTGGFSVSCASAGAATTSVDISGRYLEWARRNFAHNGLDAAEHHFARFDARGFIDLAARKGWRYNLIVIDPPTFASANRRRGVKAWNAERDLGALAARSAEILDPGGAIFVSTNAAPLADVSRLRRLIGEALEAPPRWLDVPHPPEDFPGAQDFSAWAMFRTR